MLTKPPVPYDLCVADPISAAFNQEKALVGAFSVITNLRMELFDALDLTMMAVVAAMLTRTMQVQ